MRQFNFASSSVFRLTVLSAVLAFTPAPVAAGTYPVTLDYTQSIDLILDQSRLNSDGWSHGIDWIDASGDGTTVAFWTIAETVSQPSQRHMYVMSWDGTNLREITPTGDAAAMTNPRWPRLNHDGSRMFFNANDYNDMYYINTTTGQLVHFVDTPGGTDFRKPFQINRDGTAMWYLWDDPNPGCETVGIWKYSQSSGLSLVLGLHQLPYDDYCNRNRLAFLGASNTGRAIVSWTTHDYCGNCTSMFVSNHAARIPNESVAYVYALQDLPHRQISEDGSRCLYHRGQDRSDGGTDYALELVNLDTSATSVLYEGSVGRPAISLDGACVRFNPPIGAYATFMGVADGSAGQMRDTISYFTPLLDAWSLSNICADNRRWFGCSSQDWGALQKLYRYVRNPDATKGEYGDCPRIVSVAWSRPALLNDGEMTITGYVTVSDPQGLSNIESVGLFSQTDYGREAVEWDTKGRAPLSAGGDSSGTYLNDGGDADGHGDAQPGDGIYTFNAFRTRSWCDFWDHYASRGLPISIPIRIVAKDRDNNYAMADTYLTVTDDPSDAQTGSDTGHGTGDDSGDDTGGDAGSHASGNDRTGGGDDGDGTHTSDGNGDTSDQDGSDAAPVDDASSLLPIGACPAAAAIMLTLSLLGLACARGRRARH